MKLLLCSDFSGVGYRYLKRFFNNFNGLNCLFIPYAEGEFLEEENSAEIIFKSMGINVIFLTKNYKFSDKIDIVYVKGGNVTMLLHLLQKFNQFEKIKKLIESGVLYIGSSAGAIIVGNDTEYTLDAEPYEFDLKKLYGKNALNGFGIIDKMIFVHTSKYRMCRAHEMQDKTDIFRTFDTDCYPAYLNDKKKFDKNKYMKIANNQVYFENGKTKKILTYDWRKIPIKTV